MATLAKKVVDYDAIRAEWREDTKNLVDVLEAWLKSYPSAEAKVLKGEGREVTEPYLGTYKVSELEAHFDDQFGDAITVEPAARNYPGNGFVNVIAWPTLRRVFLRQGETRSAWVVYTDSNIPLHQDWNEVNFHRLIDDLRAEL